MNAQLIIGATRYYGENDWFRELTVNGVTFLAPLDEQDKAGHMLAALAAPKEAEVADPQSCREDDGCPTEGAVLRREWRAMKARIAELEVNPPVDQRQEGECDCAMCAAAKPLSYANPAPHAAPRSGPSPTERIMVSSGPFGAFYTCSRCAGTGVTTEGERAASQPEGDQRQERFICSCGMGIRCGVHRKAASPPEAAAVETVDGWNGDDVILPHALYEKIFAKGEEWKSRAIDAETKLIAALAGVPAVDGEAALSNDELAAAIKFTSDLTYNSGLDSARYKAAVPHLYTLLAEQARRALTHPAGRDAKDAALAALESKPQADSHQWDADGEACLKCGDKDWMGGPCAGPRK
jgi:hypothetical protein